MVLEPVDSSRTPRYAGSAGLLNGNDTSKSPKVAVRDPGKLFLDLLHVVASSGLVWVSMTEKSRSELGRTRPLFAACSASGLKRMVA